ncbi:hypothetical protein ACIBJD_33585 [Kitasatospora sp. NPDC050467]|uniref:hypothetical protein n=1 Tax=Kitasatospora sp. NPDC050467 TaxID=3364053 RepID=UPI0037891A08
MVHMSISGAPPLGNVVADTVGQSYRLIAVPGPSTAGDYVSPADQVVRTRWQVDTSAPIEEAAAQPVALADAGADPVKVELSGRADAVVKVEALIRALSALDRRQGFRRRSKCGRGALRTPQVSHDRSGRGLEKCQAPATCPRATALRRSNAPTRGTAATGRFILLFSGSVKTAHVAAGMTKLRTARPSAGPVGRSAAPRH